MQSSQINPLPILSGNARKRILPENTKQLVHVLKTDAYLNAARIQKKNSNTVRRISKKISLLLEFGHYMLELGQFLLSALSVTWKNIISQ